jgi:hypothetical protein
LHSGFSKSSTQVVSVEIGVTLPSFSSLSKNSGAARPVRTMGGANALIVIPSSMIFGPSERTSPRTACLEVPYRVSFGKGYIELNKEVSQWYQQVSSLM